VAVSDATTRQAPTTATEGLAAKEVVSQNNEKASSISLKMPEA
jgi:hypothetical protein